MKDLLSLKMTWKTLGGDELHVGGDERLYFNNFYIVQPRVLSREKTLANVAISESFLMIVCRLGRQYKQTIHKVFSAKSHFPLIRKSFHPRKIRFAHSFLLHLLETSAHASVTN